MKPLPERLNDQLESCIPSLHNQQLGSPISQESGDPDVGSLLELAQRFSSSDNLRVDLTFARRLEARMLAHNALQLRKQATSTRPSWLFSAPLRLQVVLGVLILSLLLGSATLVAAAQVTNPTNPLYTVKSWEQHVQRDLTTSASGRAELDLQMANEQLNSLQEHADLSQAIAYQQSLTGLDQQIDEATQTINTLPSGQERDHYSFELGLLKKNARQTLRSLVPRLSVSEQLATTLELGRLGDVVPSLGNATVKLSPHPTAVATISIGGSNLQTGLQLLVDSQPVVSTGSYQNGVYVFVVNWTGKPAPKTIGILNPDGTAAQTTAIVLTNSDGNSNNPDGKSNSDSKGSNGNNGSNSNEKDNGHEHEPGNGGGNKQH